MGRLRTSRKHRRYARRAIPAQVSVTRPGGKSKRAGAFKACVRIGTVKYRRVPSPFPGTTTEVSPHRVHCASGKNPREALARAFTKAAQSMRKRQGAFAGRR